MQYFGRAGIVISLILLCMPGVLAEKVEWPVSVGGNGHYYEAISVPSGITWDDANTAATASGGHLLTITSEAENDFVYNLVSDPKYWYKEPQWGHSVGPWLGGYQPTGSSEPSGGWTWVTGEPFSYNNWRSDQPDNYAGDDRILFLGPSPTPKASTWDDVSHDWKSHSYIVEWDIGGSSSAASVPAYNFPKIPIHRYPSPSPSPSGGATGADLTITNVKEYRYKQADGTDSYIFVFIVKNIGDVGSGATKISWETQEKCEPYGTETNDATVPHLDVPALDPGQSAYVTTTMAETPECSEAFGGINVNLPVMGQFDQTPETNYDNNWYQGWYSVPDNSISYSPNICSIIADAIFTKINEIRKNQQPPLPGLARNSQLDTVAQGFSDSMAQSGYPSSGDHDAGGNNWGDCSASGRCYTLWHDMKFNYPAENIIQVNPAWKSFGCDGVPTTVGDTPDGIAAYTVLSWVEHDACRGDGHKKTLLSDPSNYGDTNDYLPNDVGIGVAQGSDGSYLITADFANK